MRAQIHAAYMHKSVMIFFFKKLAGQEIHVMCFTYFLPIPSHPVPPFRQWCHWVAAWVCVFCHAYEISISIQIVIVLECSYSQIKSFILLFHITWMVHFMVAGKYGFSTLSVVGFENASVLERQIVWGMSHVSFGRAILVAEICSDAHSLAQWKLKTTWLAELRCVCSSFSASNFKSALESNIFVNISR